jgi:TonB family protein
MKPLKKIIALIVLSINFSTIATAASDTDWTRQAIAKVAAQKTTPRSAQLRGSKGVVEMAVQVDGGGMITDYRMIKSSGVPILDMEADLILMRVGSFDVPPGRKPARLVIPIRW